MTIHIGLYPGTFDPLTLGHIDMIERASHICDQLIIGVAENSGKSPLFSLSQRLNFVQKQVDYIQQKEKGISNIKVESFTGLLTDFARQKGASFIIRGLRAVSDFEYEFQLANMNRAMSPDLESVFLTPKAKFSFLSSTLVREIASMGGEISSFVDPVIEEALKKRFK